MDWTYDEVFRRWCDTLAKERHSGARLQDLTPQQRKDIELEAESLAISECERAEERRLERP